MSRYTRDGDTKFKRHTHTAETLV